MLKTGILRRLQAFVGEAEPNDDLTMVLLRMTAPVGDSVSDVPVMATHA